MLKIHVSLLVLLATVFTVSCTKKKNYEEKVLNTVIRSKLKGLDPVNAGDSYSSREVARVYESLLAYHYLKRPYELIPNLAESMPTVSKDGLTYTFKIKKGITFHDNKCFTKTNGTGRELKASDFVYSIKRMADLKNNSTGWWLLDGRIAGLNEWRKKYAGKKANYDEAISGLMALDDYTLQFKLTSQYPQFLYSLAMVYTAAVPREAVDFYGEEIINNPVGTGPFITGTYNQTNMIEYTKNPKYRDVFYPTEGAPGDKEKGLLVDAGKKLPLVDKVKATIITESSTMWLAFENGNLDFSSIPKDNFDNVVIPGKGVADTYTQRGIDLEVTPDLDITYIAFNHDDPIFKGNVKLRQAMSLAYNHALSNKLFYNDTGVLAQGIVPPGIPGYDPNYSNPYKKFDLEKAKRLLAEAGYPEGKGLPTLTYETTATTVSRQMSEFFQKNMAKIGVKIKVNTNTWPQLTQKTKKRQAQMFGMAWIGDYPDAENFLQLLYGPNSSPGPNGSNFNDPVFNKKFEMAKNMQAGPERTKLYTELNQYLSEKAAIMLGVYRTSFVVKHSWSKNYKYSTFKNGNSKYYSIDLKKKEEVIKSGILKKRVEAKKTASAE